MNHPIHLSDIVALTEDLPERRLWRGQVGTVVELLAPDVFEVEFCDNDGPPMPASPFAPINLWCCIIGRSRPPKNPVVAGRRNRDTDAALAYLYW
jgi:hypothetical protein